MGISGSSPYILSILIMPRIEFLGLERRTVILPASFYGSNVIDITRNRQVIQVYSTIVRSSDLKIANQNNSQLTTMIIDDPEADYIRTVADICIPMITRFDWLMFVFRDMEGNIMRLNGEFKLHLTMENVYDLVPSSITLMNQFSMIEVFGNTTKKEMKLDNPLLFDQCYISSVLLYTDFVMRNVPTDQVVVIDEGTSLQEVLILRGTYDIEAIITKPNASDTSLFELVYSGENVSHPYSVKNRTISWAYCRAISIAHQSITDSFLFVNTSFHFDFSRTDRYVAPTVITGFILLVVHAQAVTSVLAFRVHHQFVVLSSTHPFPCTFQPLNKAVHL